MKIDMKRNRLSLFTFLIFVVTSITLFIYLNRVQPYYFIDEVFHIPQTQRYCDGNFTSWDPKITTLPGVYLITTIFLAPFGFCNETIFIRSTNLIATFLNFFLISSICRLKNSQDSLINLVSSYNIVLFPPLFFWFFLYYTDVFSVTMILAVNLLHLQGRIKSSALAGVVSVIVRQTNIIWVALIGIEEVLNFLELKAEKSLSGDVRNSSKHLQWLLDTINVQVRRGLLSFLKFSMEILSALTPYIIVGILFLAFIVWNGDIVVGDRTAHVPTIHVPQLFYFFAFTFCFAWPYMLAYLKAFLCDSLEHWIVSSFIFSLLVVIIHSNTLVHPYVLADNRHYVFYVWNYFMGRYSYFKYLPIPFYCFCFYAFFKCLKNMRFLSRILFFICTCVVLVPQLLLEPRYFIIPYIIFRLNLQNIRPWQIALETLTMFLINFVQFYIFVSKVFYWKDQEYPQRISW
ncbi:putative Dol-P-Glc:Glc(2)Man(9)GlcNAc(2)-PP-Dol alpha-1,2-glucosyltransferase [Leptopilina heterotoma]|uniref:putative Dol-P-Glc:Glc(2)Man(9)GlcNAc(2)-PP-Dol alpha-1,2-glucosyltransferase n=1 Tax=Leptopilina heterotoma TaxID=63436 RepID=UPI001CA90B20|nr:putative Dol-P-Glc:Glc(2)Man(9)GlcNAc(2)-PP-Dol alpha-1,2-glucosyltransferase [Leptopilina heterotoma]